MYEKGYYIVCLPCERYRSKSDSVANLCYQYYDYYFKEQYCFSEAHKVAMNILKDNNQTKSYKKVKIYSQSMLHKFFLPISKKDDTSNEIFKPTSPTESIECSTVIALTP